MQDKIEINGVEYKRVEECETISDDFKVWEIGETYHVETYTKYYTGRVVGETDTHILLREACYVASTGRFMEYARGSDPSESEPFAPGTLVRVRKDSEVMSIKRELVLEQI